MLNLCPLLFNIFLCDLFLLLPNIDIASYGYDNSPYAMNKSTNEVVRDIKMASEWFFTWFQNNSMKANPDNFYLLFTDTDCQGMEVCYEKFENSFCKNCLA